MADVLILSHVVAGVTTLISGLLAAFFGKKGGKLHRQVGLVFYWSMFWIFISALLIISFVRFSAFLLVIAVFSWYMTFSGVRVLKLKKTMMAKPVDWTAAIITLLSGLFFIGMGFSYQLKAEWSSVVGYLCFFFGIFTAQTAWENIKGFRRGANQEKMWWWFAHMNSMCGALIASITAFTVQNGEIFKLPSEMMWLPWVVPTIIGSPLIAYSMNKYRKKFKVGKYAALNN
ncbi:hypothetical protein [Roseivirga sp.]|jgi:uncharacterized membrane protein|uniref:hypothetical protein n=1 Tax=Roseivirga sp. TaxID=1964215 RepID=UPI000D7B6D63|nr:hypothetical protein [Roseivirga sp.]MBO6494101.1 hypothetical protein [Roseivirga sp.]PWL30652.1 MAG: hypothetical protein DCO95_04025 [Roseivirga sp. XM-24bin3]